MIKKRFVALLIDGLLYTFVGGAIEIFCDIVLKENFVRLYCLLYPLAVMLLLCKDCVGGQSIGKKKTNIQIINSEGKAINPAMSIVRNLSLIILPIDFIVFLITGKRIFDKIFKTDVVQEDKSIKVDYKRSIIVLGLFYLLLSISFWFILKSDSFVTILN